MLKDALQELLKNPDGTNRCKVGRIVCDLDEETAKIFISALRSNDVQTTALVKTLMSDGIKISREFLGHKRQCFRDPEVAKNCCVMQQIADLDRK